MNNNGKSLSIFGGAGLIVGALLPWATMASIFGTISSPGIEGDGLISAAAGLVILIAGLSRKGNPGNPFSLLISLLSALTLYMAFNTYINVSVVVADIAADDVAAIASVGSGLYVTLVAAFLSLVGGLLKVPGEKAMAETEGETN